MLKKETRKILKDLSSISSTAIITYPITGVQDIDRSIVAFINVEELGEEKFEDFGLMNINEFLNIIDIVENGEISIKDKIATIKNDTTVSKYYTTDISIIEDAYGTKPAILENIDKAPEAASFEISAELLSTLVKSSSLLKLNDLIIKEENGVLTVDVTGTTQDSNSIKTTIMGSCSDVGMNITIDMNNLKKIPMGSYSIRIAKNPKSGSYITKWTSIDLPSLQIVVSLLAAR